MGQSVQLTMKHSVFGKGIGVTSAKDESKCAAAPYSQFAMIDSTATNYHSRLGHRFPIFQIVELYETNVEQSEVCSEVPAVQIMVAKREQSDK